jgi:hypothetical protein
MLKWPLFVATCVVSNKQKICSLRRTTDPSLDELMAMMTILERLSAGLKAMLIQIASTKVKVPTLTSKSTTFRMGHPRESCWMGRASHPPRS